MGKDDEIIKKYGKSLRSPNPNNVFVYHVLKNKTTPYGTQTKYFTAGARDFNVSFITMATMKHGVFCLCGIETNFSVN